MPTGREPPVPLGNNRRPNQGHPHGLHFQTLFVERLVNRGAVVFEGLDPGGI
jgi:hypothetical protein